MGWNFENSKSKLERFLQKDFLLEWNYYIPQQSPVTRDFELNSTRSVSFNPRFQKFIHTSAQTQTSWGGSSSRSSMSSSSLSSKALIRAHLAIPQLQGTGCSSVAGSSSWINKKKSQMTGIALTHLKRKRILPGVGRTLLHAKLPANNLKELESLQNVVWPTSSSSRAWPPSPSRRRIVCFQWVGKSRGPVPSTTCGSNKMWSEVSHLKCFHFQLFDLLNLGCFVLIIDHRVECYIEPKSKSV